MKRIMCSLIVIVMALSLAACGPSEVPYGKWQSEDPCIVLDINPDAVNKVYTGTYWDGQESRELSVYVLAREHEISIYDCSPSQKKPKIGEEWFCGTYSIKKDGKLYLEQPAQTIVFELIEEYEVPEA